MKLLMSYKKMAGMSLMCGFEYMILLIQNPVQRGIKGIGICVGKYIRVCILVGDITIFNIDNIYLLIS